MMTVRLIAHTPEPEKVVAAAAKLCYSDAHITDLLDGLDEEKTAKFLTMLSDLGHASPIEHASFTFGIEGVSRAFLAQITRHRIASFSVQSQRYVREFGGQSQSLLFTGAPGLGKTHLSLAIAEGVAKAGHLVMYVSAPHLMDQLELGKFQKDDAALEFREIIFGCDLLVIDDLGTELVTRYTQAEVYDLVNHRLNTGKPTIINTNLGLQEIERTYSSRVHSRLAGMYAVVQFRGRDIRLQKKQEG